MRCKVSVYLKTNKQQGLTKSIPRMLKTAAKVWLIVELF